MCTVKIPYNVLQWICNAMHYAGVIAHSGHSGHSITCVTELIRDLAVTGLTGIQTGPDWKKKAKKKKWSHLEPVVCWLAPAQVSS